MLYPIFGWLATATTVTCLSTNVAVTSPVQVVDKQHPLPDSIISVPIKVENKDRQPTVVVEKNVSIPKGYAYTGHYLSLEGAFPVDGMEGSTEWLEGPDHSWSVFSEAKPDDKANVKQVVLRATASPGRKNIEIGAEATLYINLQRIQGAD